MNKLFVIVVILWFLSPARAADLMIMTEDFPPYNYQENGSPAGLSTEVVKAVITEAGLTAEFRFVPWARAYKTAERVPNTLIYSIARIPEREDAFIWVGEIAPYRTSLYKLTLSDHVQAATIAQARNYRIGVSVEDVIYTYLKREGFKLEVVGSDQLNIRKLVAKRLDVIAYDEASFVYAVQQNGYQLDQFQRILRLDELSGSLYMALNKDSDPKLAERLTAALQQVHEKGVYRQINAEFMLMN